MIDEQYLNRLRRLRILQILQRITPNPMGEVALLSALQQDVELNPTLERVRQSLTYLQSCSLITLLNVPGSDWVAGQLSSEGQQFLESNDSELDIFLPTEKPVESFNGNFRGRVSSIVSLPIEVKAWLDQELVNRNFSGYRQLAGLLAERGYEISRSAIGRYGKKFKEEQETLKQSIEMAKAFAEVVGDDGAAMNQTLTALAQQELMTVIREKQYADAIKLPELVRSIASLNRSDINTRKFQIEQAARQKALHDAANAAERSMVNQGLTQQTIDDVKNGILGIN